MLNKNEITGGKTVNYRNRTLLICLCFVYMAGVLSHAQETNSATLIQQLEQLDTAAKARQSLVEIGVPALPQLMENALTESYLLFMQDILADTTQKQTETTKVSQNIRYGCARVLVLMGKTAVPALIEALGNNDRVYRENASILLARMGAPALTALTAALDAEKPEVRFHALVTLDHMMTFSLNPLAPPLSQTPTPLQPLTLLRLPPKMDIVRGLIKGLTNEDLNVRDAAIGAFMREENSMPEAIPALIRLLYYGTPTYTPDAATLLLRYMGPAGTVALTQALANSQWLLRFGAATAYGYEFAWARESLSFNPGPLPPPVVPIVAEGLKLPDKEAREWAVQVLWALKGAGIEEAGTTLDAFLPPENPVDGLCYFLRWVANPNNERVIIGQVTDIQFVPRPTFEKGISTDVSLKIHDHIKGQPNTSKNPLTFTIPGGLTPDGRVVDEKGTPAFETGEQAIVFIRTNPNFGQYPHDGLTIAKYGKITVQNDRVSISYTFTPFKIVTPGIGSVEKQNTRWLSLPVNFAVKFAKATLIDAEAVLPIDEQLRTLAKNAPKADGAHQPKTEDLNRFETQLDVILEGQNPNKTKVKNKVKNKKAD